MLNVLIATNKQDKLIYTFITSSRHRNLSLGLFLYSWLNYYCNNTMIYKISIMICVKYLKGSGSNPCTFEFILILNIFKALKSQSLSIFNISNKKTKPMAYAVARLCPCATTGLCIYNQLHPVSRVQQGRQREPSVKTTPFPTFSWILEPLRVEWQNSTPRLTSTPERRRKWKYKFK